MYWRLKRTRSSVVAAAGISLGLVASLLMVSRLGGIDIWRERAFDVILAWTGPCATAPVTVIDIDSVTLDRVGRWPWGRDRLAQLVERINAAQPAVLGIDMLLIGPDERSAGALARRLAEAIPADPGATTSGRELARLLAAEAATLPDADRDLAGAIARRPTVLGLALDPERATDEPVQSPVLLRGRPSLDLWRGESAVGSIAVIADAAAGHGVLLLPGDADNLVRRVPLLTATAKSVRPGLAIEMVRILRDAPHYMLEVAPQTPRRGLLAIGQQRLAVSEDGMLRLRPQRSRCGNPPIISAHAVLDGRSDPKDLLGRIALLGSSAPELGGLRPAVEGAGTVTLLPTVLLQTTAIGQISAGDVPIRPPWLASLETLVAIIAGGIAIAAGLRLSPLLALAASSGLAAMWLASVLALAIGVLAPTGASALLLDPLLVPGSIVFGGLAGTLTQAAVARRREAQIRRRFEQHLAPEIVARIVSQPELLKLEGEAREITAMFTDIEGFTAMTERVQPRTLVAELDAYIEGASAIIVAHGGFVEKVVGDGLHSIFNAPLDLAQHASRALDCALALSSFTERFRNRPGAAAMDFGRTRIGLETGAVIVGDVGGGRRLDYTAHGSAMNTASRLEAANKELGSSICVGPGTAARIADAAERLRPLRPINLRGRNGDLPVFEPWPESFSAADRTAYRAALAQFDSNDAGRLTELRRLAAAHPHDRTLVRLVATLKA